MNVRTRILKNNTLSAVLAFLLFFVLAAFIDTLNPFLFLWGYGFIILILLFLYLRVSFAIWCLFLLFYFFKGFYFVLAGSLSVFVLFLWPALLGTISSYVLALPLMKFLRKFKKLPQISQTEREALDAGQAGVEKEFFSGIPNFKKIFSLPVLSLSPKEKDFLDGKTTKLCQFLQEWDSVQKKSLSKEVLDKAKEDKFLGLTLPKSVGGLGFSHKAHSLILQKISSSNMPLASFVAVANSLGPAELLLQYGTSWQKEKYLPRLASGQEIPCFALTEPEAGSDASSISSLGVLFKDTDNCLKIKLNWSKRWITLSTVATLAALAFRLKDPERLLGGEEDLGITLALVPMEALGVKRGLYHNTLGVPFYNGPFEGENVIVNAEQAIIGGLNQSGKGWRMLMECLSLGRGISIPSLALGGMVRAVKVTGLYARVRKQFGRPIGYFEGVREPLARIAGLSFISQTLQDFTVSDFSSGVISPTASAIVKYNLSEFHRKVLKDSMDILSGAGISLGPKNKLAFLHITSPIFITVEGTNILTRSFILFGQGLLKCHPFLYKELQALENNDFKSLNTALFWHLYHFASNAVRVLVLSLTRGFLVFSPLRSFKKGRRFIQKLTWSASLFSFFVDIFLIGFGGKLRFKEKLSGRFADILSAQYMASSLLWRWNVQDPSPSEVCAIKWGLHYSMNTIQKSFEDLILNLDIPWFVIFRKPLYCLVRLNSLGSPPSDRLSGELAQFLLHDSNLFKDLTEYFCPSEDSEDSTNKLKKAWQLSKEAEPAISKIKKAIKQKKFPKQTLKELIVSARKQGILSEEDIKQVQHSEKARIEAIQVDAFTKEEYFKSWL